MADIWVFIRAREKACTTQSASMDRLMLRIVLYSDASEYGSLTEYFNVKMSKNVDNANPTSYLFSAAGTRTTLGCNVKFHTKSILS